MKNNYLATLVAFISICLFTNNTFAQGGYVSFNAGYAFPSGAQTLTNYTEYKVDDGLNYTIDRDTYEQVAFSLGKGVNLGATVGYMFNEHIGAELGLSYLIGGETASSYSSSEISPFYSETVSIETLTSSKMLRIIPSLVLSAGGEKIKPYVKFGLVFGKGSVTEETSYQDNSNGFSVSNSEIVKLSGGTALGLSSALGANISLSDNMCFFGELQMINMSYAPKTGELIESKVNGVNVLPTLTTAEIQTDFVDSYTSDNNNYTPYLPSQELKQRLPFGSFGINVGLKISF